jgi:hypothetical protein
VRQLASMFDLWRLDAWSQQSGKEWASILKLIFWKLIDERVDFILIALPDSLNGEKLAWFERGFPPKRQNWFVFNAEIFAQGWFAE